jgi:ADP-ribosyl-[dinitrogen reductase] hydrolase
VFDTGRVTEDALLNYKRGTHPLNAGPMDEIDNGNGSLMRILPIGVWFHGSDTANIVKASHDASRLTHGHPRSQVTCALHNLVVRGLMHGLTAEPSLIEAMRDLTDVYSNWHGNEGDRFEEERQYIQRYSRACGSGYVVDCWWSAWKCINTTDDYTDCVRMAVSLGNDTDTTAAVAGGLAGVLYGFESLPMPWLADLRLETEQHAMILEFANTVKAFDIDA